MDQSMHRDMQGSSDSVSMSPPHGVQENCNSRNSPPPGMRKIEWFVNGVKKFVLVPENLGDATSGGQCSTSTSLSEPMRRTLMSATVNDNRIVATVAPQIHSTLSSPSSRMHGEVQQQDILRVTEVQHIPILASSMSNTHLNLNATIANLTQHILQQSTSKQNSEVASSNSSQSISGTVLTSSARQSERRCPNTPVSNKLFTSALLKFVESHQESDHRDTVPTDYNRLTIPVNVNAFSSMDCTQFRHLITQRISSVPAGDQLPPSGVVNRESETPEGRCNLQQSRSKTGDVVAVTGHCLSSIQATTVSSSSNVSCHIETSVMTTITTAGGSRSQTAVVFSQTSMCSPFKIAPRAHPPRVQSSGMAGFTSDSRPASALATSSRPMLAATGSRPMSAIGIRSAPATSSRPMLVITSSRPLLEVGTRSQPATSSRPMLVTTGSRPLLEVGIRSAPVTSSRPMLVTTGSRPMSEIGIRFAPPTGSQPTLVASVVSLTPLAKGCSNIPSCVIDTVTFSQTAPLMLAASQVIRLVTPVSSNLGGASNSLSSVYLSSNPHEKTGGASQIIHLVPLISSTLGGASNSLSSVYLSSNPLDRTERTSNSCSRLYFSANPLETVHAQKVIDQLRIQNQSLMRPAPVGSVTMTNQQSIGHPVGSVTVTNQRSIGHPVGSVTVTNQQSIGHPVGNQVSFVSIAPVQANLTTGTTVTSSCHAVHPEITSLGRLYLKNLFKSREPDRATLYSDLGLGTSVSGGIVLQPADNRTRPVSLSPGDKEQETEEQEQPSDACGVQWHRTETSFIAGKPLPATSLSTIVHMEHHQSKDSCTSRSLNLPLCQQLNSIPEDDQQQQPSGVIQWHKPVTSEILSPAPSVSAPQTNWITEPSRVTQTHPMIWQFHSFSVDPNRQLSMPTNERSSKAIPSNSNTSASHLAQTSTSLANSALYLQENGGQRYSAGDKPARAAVPEATRIQLDQYSKPIVWPENTKRDNHIALNLSINSSVSSISDSISNATTLPPNVRCESGPALTGSSMNVTNKAQDADENRTGRGFLSGRIKEQSTDVRRSSNASDQQMSNNEVNGSVSSVRDLPLAGKMQHGSTGYFSQLRSVSSIAAGTGTIHYKPFIWHKQEVTEDSIDLHEKNRPQLCRNTTGILATSDLLISSSTASVSRVATDIDLTSSVRVPTLANANLRRRRDDNSIEVIILDSDNSQDTVDSDSHKSSQSHSPPDNRAPSFQEIQTTLSTSLFNSTSVTSPSSADAVINMPTSLVSLSVSGGPTVPVQSIAAFVSDLFSNSSLLSGLSRFSSTGNQITPEVISGMLANVFSSSSANTIPSTSNISGRPSITSFPLSLSSQTQPVGDRHPMTIQTRNSCLSLMSDVSSQNLLTSATFSKICQVTSDDRSHPMSNRVTCHVTSDVGLVNMSSHNMQSPAFYSSSIFPSGGNRTTSVNSSGLLSAIPSFYPISSTSCNAGPRGNASGILMSSRPSVNLPSTSGSLPQNLGLNWNRMGSDNMTQLFSSPNSMSSNKSCLEDLQGNGDKTSPNNFVEILSNLLSLNSSNLPSSSSSRSTTMLSSQLGLPTTVTGCQTNLDGLLSSWFASNSSNPSPPAVTGMPSQVVKMNENQATQENVSGFKKLPSNRFSLNLSNSPSLSVVGALQSFQPSVSQNSQENIAGMMSNLFSLNPFIFPTSTGSAMLPCPSLPVAAGLTTLDLAAQITPEYLTNLLSTFMPSYSSNLPSSFGASHLPNSNSIQTQPENLAAFMQLLSNLQANVPPVVADSNMQPNVPLMDTDNNMQPNLTSMAANSNSATHFGLFQEMFIKMFESSINTTSGPTVNNQTANSQLGAAFGFETSNSSNQPQTMFGNCSWNLSSGVPTIDQLWTLILAAGGQTALSMDQVFQVLNILTSLMVTSAAGPISTPITTSNANCISGQLPAVSHETAAVVTTLSNEQLLQWLTMIVTPLSSSTTTVAAYNSPLMTPNVNFCTANQLLSVGIQLPSAKKFATGKGSKTSNQLVKLETDEDVITLDDDDSDDNSMPTLSPILDYFPIETERASSAVSTATEKSLVSFETLHSRNKKINKKHHKTMRNGDIIKRFVSSTGDCFTASDLIDCYVSLQCLHLKGKKRINIHHVNSHMCCCQNERLQRLSDADIDGCDEDYYTDVNDAKRARYDDMDSI